jgi:hypothetical protein
VLDLDLMLLVEGQHAIVEHVHRRHGQLRQIQLAEAQRRVGIDHRLHVDLAHALDGAHEVGVLTKQVTGLGRFYMLLGIGELAAVTAQQAELRLGQHAAPRRRLLLQPEQTLVAERDSVALPDVAHRRGRDADPHQPQLLADAQVAEGGVAFGHLQDLLLEFGRCLVGHPGPPTVARSQTLGSVLLESFLDLVEVTATDAGALARQADVL